ncbi:MAG: T9SS type A sorting domain-containing protein [Lewinellaceae bacterium]|nr:T9SS type A sorting domain-containing protein [Lewinellaceae bacterium]
MKPHLILLLPFFLPVLNSIRAQPCLPEGITFSSQAQINSFPISYPGCTEILGDVWIEGSDITNLTGLSSITSIGGNLEMWYVPLTSPSGLESLTSVGGNIVLGVTQPTGLKNLTSVGGNLELAWCFAANLSELESLTSVGGNFVVAKSTLTDLSGLDNLTSIGGNLWLYDNSTLTSLKGLESLTSTGGLNIDENNKLLSLSGLDNLTSINDIDIYKNEKLTSLDGLESLDYTTLSDLSIQENPTLCFCNVQPICDYIENGGPTHIYGNGYGCKYRQQIQDACQGISPPPCLPGGIAFESQAQIDSFPLNHPDCAVIGGRVGIWESMDGNITSLDSLYPIITIGGSLMILNNASLTDLRGLDNLTYIGEDLKVSGNGSLTNLTGMNNLTYIEGSLVIFSNKSLVSLNGLRNMAAIEGKLEVIFNDMLTSLGGLVNLDPTTIQRLMIFNNRSLPICEIPPVCDYLENKGEAKISDNAPGCNSEAEILKACQSTSIQDMIQSFPNPTNGIVYFMNHLICHWNISVLDATGRVIIPAHQPEECNMDLSSFPPGLYFLQINTGQETFGKRIVKL